MESMLCELYLNKAIILKKIKLNKSFEIWKGQLIFLDELPWARQIPVYFHICYFIQASQQPVRGFILSISQMKK